MTDKNADVQTHHDAASRAMWHTNCDGYRFGSPMRPVKYGVWKCERCGATTDQQGGPAMTDKNAPELTASMEHLFSGFEIIAGQPVSVYSVRGSELIRLSDHATIVAELERERDELLEALGEAVDIACSKGGSALMDRMMKLFGKYEK